MLNNVSISGKQISAREVGLVGSHGTEKLQPFMVAFFRAPMPTANKKPDHIMPVIQNETTDDDEDEGVISRRSTRIRRQTPNSNRKRSKETEEFGWNPYAGMCDVKSVIIQIIITYQINLQI